MTEERALKVASRVISILKVRFPSALSDMRNNQELMGLMAQEWARDLARFEDEDIQRGLDAVRDSGASFFPSLPEFTAMCKAGMDSSHKPMLPEPEYKPVSEEKRKEYMKQLRGAISGMQVH